MLLKPVEFEQHWNTLQKTVKNMLSLDRVTTEEWSRSYNDIFILCNSSPFTNVYALYESTKLLLKEHVHELLSIIQTESNGNQLQNYYFYWQKYSQRINKLNSLYRYFNKINKRKLRMCLQTSIFDVIERMVKPVLMEIRELGLNMWKHNMILLMDPSISKLVFIEINKQRHNISTISSDTITGVINSLIEVQMPWNNQLEFYESYFEEPFLELIREYFRHEAAKLLQEFTVCEYSVKILQYIKEEEIRFKKYLPDRPSTCNTIQIMCYQHFVIDHFNLIQEESVTIIKEEQFCKMQSIYKLLNEANHGLNKIADIFRQHIEQHGKSIIKSLIEKQVCLHYVEALIDFHKTYESIVIDVFNNNILFIEALRKAFTIIVNYKIEENQRSKSPEYLSNYCEMLLKKLYKGINKVEFENKLPHLILLFKYLNDKDIFRNIYQKQLAVRLIHHQSHCIDIEEGMIVKFKEANDYEFANNLQKMLIDIRVSDRLNTQFHNEFLKTANDKLNVSFSFSTCVLKSDVWPLNLTTASSFVLPKQLIPYTQYFEVFYKEKFKGRALTWIHHISRSELILNYLKKTYIVKLHMFQMSILLLFEDYDTLKYSDIYDLLQVNNDEFKKHIDSLVNCKLLLLDGDFIKLNMMFANKHTTFHVKLNNQKDRQQEIEQTVKTTEDYRKLQLQATIIRIMKARKTLRHKLLVNEIFSQSNLFLPTNTLIKAAIEILIDKRYLERNNDVYDEYNYVA